MAFDPTDPSFYSQTAGNEADASLFVAFGHEARENPARSELEGRPVFDQVEMIRIVVPGSKDEVVREVNEGDRQRFAPRYAKFKKGDDTAVSGTPLEQWPALSVSRIAELKAIDIYSVDQLAAASDDIMPKLGIGGRELVEKAKARLAAAADGATVERLAAENLRLTERCARLAAENAQMKLELSRKEAAHV
jgi:hypothetical protein